MYDVVLAANAAAESNSASASTRSTIMGGSPRSNNTEGGNHNQQLLSLADMEQPYQYADPDHIYHTLDSNSGGGNGGEHPLESVGVIDVKLPNGRTVAATLVR